MAKKVFKKGEKIIEEGTMGREMYIILSGKAQVYKKIHGKITKLGTLGPDDFFGEMSLFLNLPRSATVKALAKTKILTFDKNSFLESVRADPGIASQIITILSNRLLEAHSLIIRLEGEKKSLQMMYKSKK
jgi:CRP-like cAMP-binding protein